MGESAREALIFVGGMAAGLVLLLRAYGDSWRDIGAIVGMTALVLVPVMGLAWLAETIG